MEEKPKQPTGRAKGGVKVAENMTQEQRRERAAKAAAARWGAMKLQATHKGSFKDDFGIDVECYVLNDTTKTAVISQRGMGIALGFSTQGGGRLPRFISGKTIAPYLGLEVREKLENPLIFQGPAAVSGSPSINKVDAAGLAALRKLIDRWRPK